MKRTLLVFSLLVVAGLSACGGGDKGPGPFIVKSVDGYWDVYRTYDGEPERGPDLTRWNNSGTGYGIEMHAVCSSTVLAAGGVDIAGEIFGSDLSLTNDTVAWEGTLDDVLGLMSGTFSDSRGNGTWRAEKTAEHACVTYEVYGGNMALPCGGIEGYNPEAHSYAFLGSAASTESFAGSFPYYVVVTRDYNVIHIDTVQGGVGAYFGTQCTGNTTDSINVGGAPDGFFATVGEGRMSGGGYIAIDAAADQPASITAVLAP